MSVHSQYIYPAGEVGPCSCNLPLTMHRPTSRQIYFHQTNSHYIIFLIVLVRQPFMLHPSDRVYLAGYVRVSSSAFFDFFTYSAVQKTRARESIAISHCFWTFSSPIKWLPHRLKPPLIVMESRVDRSCSSGPPWCATVPGGPARRERLEGMLASS